MAELLAAKIAIEEETPQVRKLTGGPTATLLAVGIAERGPIGVPTLIQSPEEYAEKFGGYSANAFDLPNAVANFFEEGGQTAWVTRTVHYTDITNASSKTSVAASGTATTAALAQTAGSVLATGSEPFALVDGDTLDVLVDGGGAITATFNAAAASLTSGNTETFALADAQTLTVEIDGGATQTITFNTAAFADIANATALEVANVINAALAGGGAAVSTGAVRIFSDSLGTDSSVQVTGGTANAALGFSTTITNGTGDAADASAVTVAELKTLIEGDVAGVTVTDESGSPRLATNTLGSSGSVQVAASSSMDTKLGFDNAAHAGNDAGALDTLQIDGKTDGAYGNSVTVEITGATSGRADEFNLRVLEAGVLSEVFPNVTMDDTASNFVETIVNATIGGSVLITVTDLDAATSSPDDRPANQTVTMSGGDDGLTGLVDNDFIGSSISLTGIRSFDRTPDGRILIVPGRATSAVHNAMITYCEITRDKSMFAVLDPPEGQSAEQIVDYVRNTAALKELSEFGAIYWPRIKVDNPDQTLYGTATTVIAPPSGAIAGMYARTDAASPGGVYEAPAGVEVGRLVTCRGVETDEVNDEKKRDLVFPELINPITAIRGKTRHVDGARTLKSNGNFPTIGERRGVIYIETTLKDGLEFAKHRKIKAKTRKQLERTATVFLIIQTNNDAFASDKPTEAFFVDFSEQLNTAAVAFQRKIVGRVGLATAKPAEFIVILISQDTRALDAELAEIV